MELTSPGDVVEETVKFISYFDKFFDCVNVSSLSTGKLQRNPFKSPYRSNQDFRLKVITIMLIRSYHSDDRTE